MPTVREECESWLASYHESDRPPAAEAMAELLPLTMSVSVEAGHTVTRQFAPADRMFFPKGQAFGPRTRPGRSSPEHSGWLPGNGARRARRLRGRDGGNHGIQSWGLLFDDLGGSPF